VITPQPADGVIAGIYEIFIDSSLRPAVYYGQSTDINRRLREHWEALTAGRHANSRMQQYWRSVGPDGEYARENMYRSWLQGNVCRHGLGSGAG